MADFLSKLREVGESVTESVSEILGRDEESADPAAPRSLDQPLVSFRDVHLSFDLPILKGVSFDLLPGSTKIITLPAISRFHSVVCDPWKLCSPS